MLLLLPRATAEMDGGLGGPCAHMTRGLTQKTVGARPVHARHVAQKPCVYLYPCGMLSGLNGTYFFELRKFVDVLDRVLDVMTAVTKVDYRLYFLMYGFATFFGISGAV